MSDINLNQAIGWKVETFTSHDGEQLRTEAEGREKACTNHCYHETGIVLCSYPPQYPTQCCHCGKAGPNRRAELPQTPPGHGRYYPK